MTGKYFCYHCQCVVSVIASSTSSQASCIHSSRHVVEKLSEQDDWFYDSEHLETQDTTIQLLGHFDQLSLGQQDQLQESYAEYQFYSDDEFDMDPFIQAVDSNDDSDKLVNSMDSRAFGVESFRSSDSPGTAGDSLTTIPFVSHDHSDWSLDMNDGDESGDTEDNNNGSTSVTFLDQDGSSGRHAQRSSREIRHLLDALFYDIQSYDVDDNYGSSPSTLHYMQQHNQIGRQNQQYDTSTTDQLQGRNAIGVYEKLTIRLLLDDDLLVKTRIDCVICQEPYQSGVSLIKMPCNHEYHKECLLQWLDHSPTCPVCRGSLKCSRPIVSHTSPIILSPSRFV